MRMTSMAVALAAILAMPTLALAQVGMENPGDTSGTTNNAGNPPGSYSAQGPVTNQGPRYTTGQGYGGYIGSPPESYAPGSYTAQGPITNPRARYTTGQGYVGGYVGSPAESYAPGSYTAQGPITYPAARYTTGQAYVGEYGGGYVGSAGVVHRRIHHARGTSRHLTR